MYDFTQLKSKAKETENWLKQEYRSIRTGRAAPALLDGVQVDCYGSRTHLNQIANIGVEDARTLRVAPYDSSQIKEVEKALTEANLGLGISVDESGLRITFPELTSERRDSLIKIAKDKLEDARISLRGIRDEVWSDIQNKERAGEISEDEKFVFKDEMENIIKSANAQLDEIFNNKEKEILE